MSLYWILALTLTLLHCLTAHTNPITSDGILSRILYNDLETLIETLQKDGCKEKDSTFYSPSGTEECTIKALDCSILELEKVRSECFDKNSKNIKMVKKTRISLNQMLSAKNITLQLNPNNCFCGKEKLEKPYNEFLNNILKLVQMLNSRESPIKA